jgi:Domain of unknown function (DUF4388)
MNRSLESGPQNSMNRSEHRPVAGSSEGSFSGRLKALSISDVLEFLRVLNRCGTLSLRDGRRQVSLQVRDGKLVGAASRGEDGSLAGFLRREGQLTQEQYESVQEREKNGEKVGRILIEAGILGPKGVWEALRRQARAIVLGLFDWEQGEFDFTEGESVAGSGLELNLPILDLIAEGIRSVKDVRLFSQRMPSGPSVFEGIPASERKVSITLEPHEGYVLGLVDGRRSLSQLTAASEIGEAETLRVVFLLFSVGYLKMRAFQAYPVEAPDSRAVPLIRRYNEMFAFLLRYLVKEVGPIGDAVMGRYFEDQRRAQPGLLAHNRLGRDGTLDEGILLRNLGRLGNGAGTENLVDGLNELLYAELLAVRRTLGASHEGRAVQGLRDLGLQPVIQPESPAPGPGKGSEL